MSNIVWIWRIIISMKWKYLLLFILLITETAATLTGVFLGKYLIDDVFIKGRFDLLYNIVSLSLLSMIIYNISKVFNGSLKYKIKIYIIKLLTQQLMSYFYRMPLLKHTNLRTGQQVQLFTGDIENIANSLSQGIPNGVQQIINVLFLFIVTFLLSPKLLLSMMIIIPVYIILGNNFGPKLKKQAKEVQDSRSKLLVHLEEGVSSTKEIIAYNRQQWESEGFKKAFSELFEKSILEGRIINKQLMLSEPLKRAVSIITLTLGGIEVLRGSISLGFFWVVYNLTSNITNSIQVSFQFIMGLSSIMANIERFREIIEKKLELKEGKIHLIQPIRNLQLDQVFLKYYKETEYIIKDVTITVPIGKKVAFVGSSGGGKSTISYLLVRLVDPTKGNILVDGKCLTSIERHSWSNKVNIVFQEPYFFPDTIRNNLLMGRAISEDEIINACKITLIHDVILSLPDGYNSIVGERGITLSGGQRQRLAIARAIMNRPEILILDEATSAMDMETERQVQKNLDQIRKEQTTIVIAHRLSSIENADLIYVLDQGKVVEHGTHKDLMQTDTIYNKLISVQNIGRN